MNGPFCYNKFSYDNPMSLRRESGHNLSVRELAQHYEDSCG